MNNELREQKILNLAERLADNEVYCNVTAEVEFILYCGSPDAPFFMDDIENYSEDLEISQWWKVSKTILRFLKDLGEPVIMDYDLWGRKGCNYSISQDMKKVAECMIED